MKKVIFWIIGIFFLIVGTAYAAPRIVSRWQESETQPDTVVALPTQELVTPTPTPKAIETPSPRPTATPTPEPVLAAQVNLNVPFTSQSPFGTWDAVGKEACEEASILMAQWYAQGKNGKNEGGYANRIPQQEAQDRVLELVDWQKQILGYWEDTTTEETLRVLKEKLGVTNARLATEISSAAFKKELSQGNIIVIPAAGQLLKNPNFKAPGPPYHMLVIRGYNDQGFITNDPGTRRGEGFIYTEANLLDAIHDWTGSDATITSGRKTAIIIPAPA